MKKKAKKAGKIRYWYLDIEIREGESEHHSKGVHECKGVFNAENYVSDFYADAEGKDDPDSDWYMFQGGCIACRVYDLKEITKKKYDILSEVM